MREEAVLSASQNPAIAHADGDKLAKATEKGRPTVTAVIPTLNEAENLAHVIPFLPSIVDEVIIVDGRSTDNTVAVAKELRPDAKIVYETRKGKGVALRAGFEAATCDIVVMLDADGSTDPTEIPVFVGALAAGADFVKGSRFMQGGLTDDMEFHRFLGNWGLTTAVRILFGGRYSDLCYGYSAFWRSVLPDLALESTGFEIETEMNIRALRANLNISEVPSREKPRVHGTSNLIAIRDGLRIAKVITQEYVSETISRIRKGKSREEHTFTDATRLLTQEAAYLKAQQADLSPEEYETRVAVLRDAMNFLLEQPVDSSVDRYEQVRLSMLGDQHWEFLDEKRS
ncbi:MAG: glycosyltransferase family 2 protein [Chloroflexota bacterium]